MEIIPKNCHNKDLMVRENIYVGLFDKIARDCSLNLIWAYFVIYTRKNFSKIRDMALPSKQMFFQKIKCNRFFLHFF